MDNFNYSYQRSNLPYSTSLQWTSFLQDNFYNEMQRDDYVDLPTFRRNDDTLSTIDYIFVGTSFSSRINDVGIDRLRAEWTDHHVLHASIEVGLIHSGVGLWRANPILIQISDFR
jgi:endonuclease/exonuclease/phosphatase family metal-dependent hydrolase